MTRLRLAILTCAGLLPSLAPAQQRPEDTEVWTPVPRVTTPGRTDASPASDAIVLFNGRDLTEWTSGDGSAARWNMHMAL